MRDDVRALPARPHPPHPAPPKTRRLPGRVRCDVRTGPPRGNPPVPATRTTLRRSIAAAAALPLLAVALTACGYGSEATKDDKVAPAAKGEKLSADTVKVGYFQNLTHATALVGDQEGLI
ncbi:MAG TPA: sulfate ABC transporter substrate-binding protein, partial [Streptomyces sp.]|nr:sulfate ABC transporter substrate-binding protein [Streptomyces sp.]